MAGLAVLSVLCIALPWFFAGRMTARIEYAGYRYPWWAILLLALVTSGGTLGGLMMIVWVARLVE